MSCSLCRIICYSLTPASPRGVIMTPPRKNLCDSFVCNSFRTPFSEKKYEWTKKILPSKKIRKKIFGGVPRITELDQNLKKYFQKYAVFFPLFFACAGLVAMLQTLSNLLHRVTDVNYKIVSVK